MAKVNLSTGAPLRGAKRWAFLERAETIRVATVVGDDPIHVSPLWFVTKDQKIYLPFDQASRHMRAIENGGRLSAVVDKGDEFASVHGVAIEGGAQRVDDEDLAEELSNLVLEKYFHIGHPYLEEYINMGEYYGRLWYELTVDKMIGWDMREATALPTLEKRRLPQHVIAAHPVAG
jgi:nitroimidazol reductase NimA-like FMN-containing flavoprotein (pyridoxamine 5'-phosphate oxidase superfamily)